MPSSSTVAREQFASLVKSEGGIKNVARRLGVSFGCVSMIKNGERRPSIKMAKKIESKYGKYGISALSWFPELTA